MSKKNKKRIHKKPSQPSASPQLTSVHQASLKELEDAAVESGLTLITDNAGIETSGTVAGSDLQIGKQHNVHVFKRSSRPIPSARIIVTKGS